MKLTILLILISLISFSLQAENSEQTRRLKVFFTNDIHGGIIPQKAEFLNPEFPPILGGGPAAARIIREARAQAETDGAATLLIDGGDTFQGTLVGTLSKGEAVVKYMNMVGYDAVVPGNHDFDEGKDNFIELVKASNFAWVACNIYDQETGEPWEWVKQSLIVEKMGLRIGITGAATVGTMAMSFPENIKGLEFRKEIPALRKSVADLRAQNVDLVVVLVHVGLPYDPREGYQELLNQDSESILYDQSVNSMEIAHFVDGIDILLGGHLHKGYQEAWEDPSNHTICLQNYANGGNLGWVDVLIDMPTKSIAGYEYAADKNSLLLLQEDQFWPDSTVAKFAAEQQELYAQNFLGVIGNTRTSLNRSSIGEAPMNNLICDVLRERCKADFAFMNFGGIRADIKAGSVTREDVFKVLPFGNEIVSFQAKGSFLKLILETKLNGGGRGLAISGAKVTFNRSLEDGSRVVNVEVNGESLDPDKVYRLATTDYLLEGNSGLFMLRRINRDNVDFHGTLLRDAIVDHFTQNSPIEVSLNGRWKKDDNAQPTSEWQEKFK